MKENIKMEKKKMMCLPKETHHRLKILATIQGINMQEWIKQRVEEKEGEVNGKRI